MARLTVETCTPTISATSCILSVRRPGTPSSKKFLCNSTILQAILYNVLLLCSMASMSHFADSIFFLYILTCRIVGTVFTQIFFVKSADMQMRKVGIINEKYLVLPIDIFYFYLWNHIGYGLITKDRTRLGV